MFKKNFGPSGNGALLWLVQHVTACVMLFIVPFGVYIMCEILSGSIKYGFDMDPIGSPLKAFVFWIFTIFSILHGTIGTRLVIEDYVGSRCMRIFLIMFFLIESLVASIILSFLIFSHVIR